MKADDDRERLVREALAMTTALFDQVLAGLADGSIQPALVPLPEILGRIRRTIFESEDEVSRETCLLALTGLVAAFGLSATAATAPRGPSEN